MSDIIETAQTKEINDERALSSNEELKNIKMSEEISDSKHSLRNTEKLNNIYTQLIHLFFGGWWFYAWIFFLFLCFLTADEYFTKCGDTLLFLNFLSRKILYGLSVVFIVLLSFPTAKGVRRFFRKLLDLMGRGQPNNKRDSY